MVFKPIADDSNGSLGSTDIGNIVVGRRHQNIFVKILQSADSIEKNFDIEAKRDSTESDNVIKVRRLKICRSNLCTMFPGPYTLLIFPNVLVWLGHSRMEERAPVRLHFPYVAKYLIQYARIFPL